MSDLVILGPFPRAGLYAIVAYFIDISFFALDLSSRFAAIQSEVDETMCDLYVQLQTAKHVELLANALFGNVLKLVRSIIEISFHFDIFNVISYDFRHICFHLPVNSIVQNKGDFIIHLSSIHVDRSAFLSDSEIQSRAESRDQKVCLL